MRYPKTLVPGRLVRRYKRFLADIDLDEAGRVTVHCPNTGSMLGCDHPGARVWLSRSDNPGRKYPMTWELVEATPGVLVGIHTGRTNELVAEAIASGRAGNLAGPLEGLVIERREYRPPGSASRFDFLGRDGSGREVLIEVKSVTAIDGDGVGIFPDAVSLRARKHATELAELARPDRRVMLVFCAQREDVQVLRAASEIDPAYARALEQSTRSGLEVVALGCAVSPVEISIRRKVAFAIDG